MVYIQLTGQFDLDCAADGVIERGVNNEIRLVRLQTFEMRGQWHGAMIIRPGMSA